MPQDKIFARKKRVVKDFQFGRETATVFDDMLSRSVPFYGEIQRMIGEIARDFAVEGTNLYDLGCSTGNTFLMLDELLPKRVRFVGVDASQDMLARAREKLQAYGVTRDVEWVHADLNQGVRVANASMVVMNLTLQFIRPLHRHRLMSGVAGGVNEQGCLVLVEKVLTKNARLNRLFIKYYYALKERQGYSRMEIAQKREALENVLIPYRIEENVELLLASGFRECDVFFKWYNFCGIIALK